MEKKPACWLTAQRLRFSSQVWLSGFATERKYNGKTQKYFKIQLYLTFIERIMPPPHDGNQKIHNLYCSSSSTLNYWCAHITTHVLATSAFGYNLRDSLASTHLSNTNGVHSTYGFYYSQLMVRRWTYCITWAPNKWEPSTHFPFLTSDVQKPTPDPAGFKSKILAPFHLGHNNLRTEMY
jgi:hypothetical protein